MNKLKKCIMEDEFRQFEIHLFKCYTSSLEVNTHQERQDSIQDFIKKYAQQIREYYCRDICGQYKACEVYDNLSRYS